MAVLKDLIVHGPSRFINTANFNSIKANTIGADNGVFNKLIATSADIGSLDVDDLTAQNATVVGLLDVKGQLHTNSWTNANIANIGGSFYISPTVSTEIAANGTPMSVTISGGSGNRTIAVSGGAFVTDSVKIYQNNTTSTASWAIGSRVMITGNVRLGTTGTDYPLGTCIGYLNASLTTSGFTIAEVNSPALESIISTIGTSLKSYNIKISMYEIGPKTSEKPVGILLTSYGVDRSTYIDIYGGVNTKNSSGYTEPNVRIGYLGGIPSYTDSAGKPHKPTGWGLFTDNGYFKGVIVADSGSIGNFTIDANSIKTGTIATTNGILISPNNTTSYTINGASRTNLRLAIGRYFGVDNDGILYASGANITNINGANITAHTITTTQITTSNLVGTNGWINLAQGTFAYNNASSGHGIAWDGTHLTISADSILLSGGDIGVAIQNAEDVANAIDSTVNGTTYYQYTTGGTTYNVLYDEDNDRYYYFDDNEQEVTVTYAQLDKDENNVPITVVSGGIQSQINENTDALGELKQTTEEQINGVMYYQYSPEYSGDIATFEAEANTGIKSLIANIEPIQNLNGYDAPWPGGGGKNKVQPTKTASGSGLTINVASDGTVTLNGTTTAIKNVEFITNIPANTQITLSLNNPVANVNLMAYLITPTGTGNPSISLGAVNRTYTLTHTTDLVKLRIRVPSGTTLNNYIIKPQIELGSTATAYEPYENICPISGWSGVEVNHSGKNLLDVSNMSTAGQNGVTFALNNGVVTAGRKANANTYRIVGSIFAENGVQYICSGCPSGGASGKYRMTVGGYGYDFGNGYTFTGDGESHDVSIDVYTGYPQDGGTLEFKPMVRLATVTDDTYEPYEGQTITKSLGQTVYGGTLDVVSGKLVIDTIHVDLGGQWWVHEFVNGRYRWFADTSAFAKREMGAILCCSQFAVNDSPVTGSGVDNTITTYSTGGTYLNCFSKDSMSDAEFKQAMSGVIAIYKLATPTEIQLTPTQVNTLLGVNNIWADSGAVSVILTPYNVIYDEDNNRYYYLTDSGQEVTVTYAQLDKDSSGDPIKVKIGGLSNQISAVDDRLGGQINGLGSQIGTLSSETSEAIEGLEGRVSKNETNIGGQGQRLGTAESSITNLQKIVIDKYEAFIEVKPSVPSITLGKRNDATVRTRLEITDEAVNFYTDGKNSAKASGKSFESPEGKFEQITMKTVSGVGDLRWIARSNRHLSLKKITGDN